MKTSCTYNFFHITKIQGNILSNHQSGKSGIQTHGTDKAVHRISSPAHSVTLASFLCIVQSYYFFSFINSFLSIIFSCIVYLKPFLFRCHRERQFFIHYSFKKPADRYATPCATSMPFHRSSGSINPRTSDRDSSHGYVPAHVK